MWYSFKAGGVRVISLNNDDVCLQDGGDNYVRGYSERRADSAGSNARCSRRATTSDTDWIVVCMHQVAMSSAHNFNGADLGIRQAWLPLFDKYARRPRADRTRAPLRAHAGRPRHGFRQHAAAEGRRYEFGRWSIPRRGTVHMIIGGGGTSAPSNQLLLDPPKCEVITEVGDQPSDAQRRARAPSARRSRSSRMPRGSARATRTHSWGFASFDVDPGQPGGMTRIVVRVWDTAPSATGAPTIFDEFMLQRPRRDTSAQRVGAAASS